MTKLEIAILYREAQSYKRSLERENVELQNEIDQLIKRIEKNKKKIEAEKVHMEQLERRYDNAQD